MYLEEHRDAFLELMQGTWIPDSQDLMPVQEPSENADCIDQSKHDR
ncbi:MAG: hypothetical protein WDO06_03460 [Actinomycetota bacterium]